MQKMAKRLCIFGKSILEEGSSFQNQDSKCYKCVKEFERGSEPECFLYHVSCEERNAEWREKAKNYENKLVSSIAYSGSEDVMTRMIKRRRAQLE